MINKFYFFPFLEPLDPKHLI